MAYIDGYLVAVPAANKQRYLDMAKAVDGMFIDYGATRIVECWSDDVPHGKLTDFYMAVQAKEDEALVFAWIEWPDKATRDKGWDDLMKDERMKMGPQDNPMVGARMIYGGFDTIFDTAA